MAKTSAAIPEKIHSYKVYNEGERLIGTQAEAEMPSLEAMTATISGPGILGEIEIPNVGHFGSTNMPLTFRTLSGEASVLMEPGPHLLTFRADQTSYDTSAGRILHRALKVVVRGFNKSNELGKLNAGNPTETKITLELFYLKITEGEMVILELDKYNEVYVVNGKDQMAEVLANT